MRRLTLTVTLVLAAGLTLIPTAALAIGPWGEVNCDRTPDAPQCTVTVVDPGDDDASDSTGTGPGTCRFGGQDVDCYSEGFGWYGGDGCYYGKDEAGYLPENEWFKRCLDAAGDITEEGIVYLPDSPAALQAVIRRAVSSLRVPAPALEASPPLGSPHVVHVPVWWWIPPASWRPRTATASLPGITITAQATPTTLTWDAGDGTRTVCAGAGTPWSAKYAPTAPSPTCGHTYTTTSRTSPNGKFTLNATITWSITWAGAGMTGTEPAITTTATTAIDVVEVRAVIR